jgi:hypothetical protein
MDIETRLKNLENLVNALSKKIDNTKFYQDADIDGVRKGVADVTPTTLTKTAYIDETEVVFTNVPKGNMTIFFDKPYTVTKEGNNVLIGFEPLEEVTTITISIL